jgi:hypothetical protein
MLAENLAGAQGSGKVRIEDIVPFFFRHGERGRAPNDPGTVNKDVDFSETLERGCQQFFKRSAIAHIRAEAQGLATVAFDFGCGLLDLGPTARRSDDIGSYVCKAETQRAPDPGSAPITIAVLPARLKMFVIISGLQC